MACFKCTTDPGVYYLKKAATAILVHNRQYRGAFKLGKHRGKYEALVQTGNKVSIWRDRNRDDKLDLGTDEISGYFGINIHRANSQRVSQIVGPHSAGCQVIQDPEEYKIFIDLCKLQIKHLGYKKFSYTLLLGE